MDKVPAKAFTLQTNATKLDQIEDRYLHRFHSILASIDGGRMVTDCCRGEGTYDLVTRNLIDVQDRGYSGDVIARMAFSKNGDIYRDVSHLLNLEQPHFNHVHWQLDVFWSELGSWGDLEGWLRRYEDGITRLVKDFGESLIEGRVLGIVPFTPVFKTLLTREPTTHIRCGAGVTSFAVMTNGRIDVCPIAPELPYSNVGDIWGSTPQELLNIQLVEAPCTTCDVLGVCGGRCLFSNKTMFWGLDWFNRICDTTRHMIRELEKQVPLARRLIDQGVLDINAFDYPEINNGCEIIP
ncbi:TIGR04084 family radical SAM/SPASM domain-containing protein [Candidatus Bathyarchaeota archaeon]|nr:TIGR04084 family radical SAM/SPASM domain-containing protein [Candidatus Bathyarchaeota archaeon]